MSHTYSWSRAFGAVAALLACGAAPAPAGRVASRTPDPATSLVASVLSPAQRRTAPREVGDDAPTPSIVDVSLEPLVANVTPGARFLLAAHIRIPPGYRIGWKIAGDVGAPTVVTFRGPPGYDIGLPQFPAPVRFTAPSGYVGYGYENETAVFVEVKAPRTVRHGDIARFDLDATWVACEKVCSGEHTAAYVELDAGAAAAPVKDVVSSLAPFRARLPKPVPEPLQTWSADDRSATLVVKVPGATTSDFFQAKMANPAPVETNASTDELRFVYDDLPRPGSRPLRGTIVATLADGVHAFDFEATIPKLGKPATSTPRKSR